MVEDRVLSVSSGHLSHLVCVDPALPACSHCTGNTIPNTPGMNRGGQGGGIKKGQFSTNIKSLRSEYCHRQKGVTENLQFEIAVLLIGLR